MLVAALSAALLVVVLPLASPATAATTGNVVVWSEEWASPAPAGLTDVIAVEAGGSSLALRSDGTVVGWGGEAAANVPAGLSGVTAIAAGEGTNMALKSNGTVVSWGHNALAVPAGLTDVIAIDTSGYHSLALRSAGTVVAWGNNGSGQTDVPTALRDVIAIAAGAAHSLALKSDGTVVAWGHNSYGQGTVPVGVSNVTAIAAGYWHNVALKSDGTVVAWGEDDEGSAISSPVGLSNVVDISAGAAHDMALKADGTVVTWGSNYYGQVSPQPDGTGEVVAIAAGRHYSVVVRSSGLPMAVRYVGGGAETPDSAYIYWQPPPNSAPVTGYRVSHDGGTAGRPSYSTTLPASESAFTFRNLIGGATYEVSVTAINAVGTGPSTTLSVTMPPATVPDVPSSVSGAAVTATSSRISWAPPATTGGSPITGYRVTHNGGSTGRPPYSTTVSASTRSFTFRNLTSGSSYTFSVAAINAKGTGPAGSVSVTAASRPTAPPIGTAISGNAGGAITATAVWSTPTSNGGSPITGYRVRALRMSSSGAVLSTTVSAVQAGDVRALAMTLPTGQYRFTVVAVNALGTSPQSARSNLVTAR